MNKIKIGITGTGSLIGQGIIKSVLRSEIISKIEMIGFDYFENTIGEQWVKKQFILPDFLKDDVDVELWLEKVIEIISNEDIKLLFIGIDFEVILFAKYMSQIESKTCCKVIVSSEEVVRIADDKYLTYTFLRDNGLFYPDTVFPEEVSEEGWKFPCIVKPRFGWGSNNVFEVENFEMLQLRLKDIENPIVQELIGDENEEYTCGVIVLDGDFREGIALKRTLKKGDTISAFYKKTAHDVIADYLKEVSLKLKPSGVCNFQLRVDESGVPKIFEINARHSGTTYMRALFGYNEVEYLIKHFLGFELKPFDLREGQVRRYYDEMYIGSDI